MLFQDMWSNNTPPPPLNVTTPLALTLAVDMAPAPPVKDPPLMTLEPARVRLVVLSSTTAPEYAPPPLSANVPAKRCNNELLVNATPTVAPTGTTPLLIGPELTATSPTLEKPLFHPIPALICAPSKFHTPALALTMPAPLDRLI